MNDLTRLTVISFVSAAVAFGIAAPGPQGHVRKPAPIVLKMRGKRVLVDRRVTPHRALTAKKSLRQPTGWQPGGPLKPLYVSAVQAVHLRKFDRAEALCREGLTLAKGDRAFADLLAQIPAWRRDTTQRQLTQIYTNAVDLVHKRHYTQAEGLCRQGLAIEPGNASFTGLLADIASKRNATLQRSLLDAYEAASTLMSQGHLRQAEAKCREGLALQPDDAVLKSLLNRIRERRGTQSG
ncbi:MAG: hypothetical protein ACYC96_16150 [Fimbriimonadaceae bacterium]